jgi:hypothetical protein
MMDMDVPAEISFPVEDASTSLTLDATSAWIDDMTFQADFTLNDANEEVWDVDLESVAAMDAAGNVQISMITEDAVDIDTKNPGLLILSANDYTLTVEDIGGTFSLLAVFDEPMAMDAPTISFPDEDPTAVITMTSGDWLNSTTYFAEYDIEDSNVTIMDIDVEITGLTDAVGNDQIEMSVVDHFDIDMSPIGVADQVDQPVVVYPNPVQSGTDLIVEMSGMTSTIQLSLFNAAGQNIASQQETTWTDDRVIISTNQLASGTYFLVLQDQEYHNVSKVQIVE